MKYIYSEVNVHAVLTNNSLLGVGHVLFVPGHHGINIVQRGTS